MENKVTKHFTDFVKDLEQLKDSELIRQAPLMVNDENVLGYLMDFLLSDQSSDEQALLERFYLQLHRCYITSDDNLMKFVCQFIFCLIWRHFSDLTKSRQFGTSTRPGLDTLLIAVYNLMIVDRENQPKTQTIRIPSLANPSIYHDPSEFTIQILRDTTRSQGESEVEKRVFMGGYPPIETLTRTKKWIVFRVLIRNMCNDLPYHSKVCQKSFILMCRMLIMPSDPNISRPDIELVARKEPKLQNRLHFKNFSMIKDKTVKNQIQHRLIMNESFLLDILDVLYILAYQGFLEECLGVVNDVLEEAQFRVLAAAVLVGNSIKNRMTSCKVDPDDLDEIPPVVPNISSDEPRKVSGGSMRDKRKPSAIVNKESGKQKGDTLPERNEMDGIDGVNRAETPGDLQTENVDIRSISMIGGRFHGSPQSARSMVSETVV